jgi:pilus assembly protein FimV
MRLGAYPRLLVLALSLPEMSHALGLGTLHIESSLNEPLSAQIDIIGATPEELQAIRASVASPELFQRFNADRPAFLSSATMLVGTDAAGKPVLNIQSSDAFTEPLVELVIDLRSGHEQLVRDYSLMLDPARTTPIISASSISASSTAVSNEAPTPLVQLPPVTVPNIVPADPDVPYRVVAHDTLRGIALHAGARSEAELQRMMRAIYQGNRAAFAGSIHRLHTGALIRIPSVAGIPALRRTDRPGLRQAARPPVVAQAEPVAARSRTSQDPDLSAVLSTMNSLHGQVQFLQQTLGETSRQLASANARLGELERGGMPHAVVASRAAVAQGKSQSSNFSLRGMLAGFALLVGALAFAWRRLRARRAPAHEPITAAEPTVEAPLLDPATPSEASSAAAPTDAGATVEMTQVADIEVDTVEMPGLADADEPDTVVAGILETQAGDATSTALDYNLSDLDSLAHHVEMPDTLRDRPAVVERRKNVVNTLMAALQRDPTRSDLRMKLLETLYTAAATNLRIFKDVVRDVVRHPERLNADEWEQVMAMGRQIAADDALFADQGSGENIADCA